MDAFKKVFSPGHSVDDELMYGTGSTKPTKESSGKAADKASHPTSSGVDDATTRSPADGATDLTPPGRPQPQDNTSTVGVKSGVFGHGAEDPNLRSEPTDTRSAADYSSQEPISHHPGTQSSDFDTRADPQPHRDFTQPRQQESIVSGQGDPYSAYPVSKGDTTSRGFEESTASGQGGTYSAYPVSKGDNASRGVDESTAIGQGATYSSYPVSKKDTTSQGVGHDSTTPATYQQPETTNTYSPHSSSKGDTVSRGADRDYTSPTAYQQTGTTSTSSPYPISTGDTSSRGVDREFNDSTPYGQPETKSTGREAGLAGGAAVAAGYALPGDSNKTTTVPDDRFSGDSTTTAGQESYPRSEQSMPGQYPQTSYDNPYASSRLDPRVDPHSSSANAGSTPIAGAAITSSRDRADPHEEYGSSADNIGLSGAKTTAEPFDGPKGTSQPLSGAPGTTEPSVGPKGTSEPLKEEKRKSKTGAMLGAIGLGGHHSKSKNHDEVTHDSPTTTTGRSEPTHAVTQDSPTTAIGRSEPTHASDSGVGTTDTAAHEDESHKGRKGGILGAIGLGGHHSKSKTHEAVTQDSPTTHADKSEPTHAVTQDSPTTTTDRSAPTHASDSGVGTSDAATQEDESHKGRKGGILGAIGLGGLAAKKHADEKPERPSAGSRRESIPTTAYPPGTSLGDKQYPQTAVGGHSAGAYGGQDARTALSAQTAHQTSPIGSAMHTDSITGTGAATGQPSVRPDSTTTHRPEESHSGRNAALGGAAAAGAGAVGVHQYSKQQAEKEEMERLEAEKAHQKALEESRKAAEKEQKAHDKAVAKEEKKAEKEHEKAVAKEEKKHEKAIVKEERKAEKEHEKALKKEEKEQEKAIKKEEKAAEKEHEKAVKEAEKQQMHHEKELAKLEEKREKEDEKEIAREQKEAEQEIDADEKDKKHGGLLGIFKRRRDSKGNEVEHDSDDQRVGTSTTTGTAAAGMGTSREQEVVRQDEEDEKRHGSDEKEKKHGGLLGVFKRRQDSKGDEVEHDNDDQRVDTDTTSGVAPLVMGTPYERQPVQPEKEDERPHGAEDKEAKKGGLLGVFKRRRDSKGEEVERDNDDQRVETSTATGVAPVVMGTPYEKQPLRQEKEEEQPHDAEEKEKKKGGLLGLFKRRRDSKGNEIEHEDDDQQVATNTPATTAGVGAVGTEAERQNDPISQDKQDPHPHESEDKDKKKGGLLGLFKRKRDSKGNEIEHEDEDTPTTSTAAAAPTSHEPGHHHSKPHHHEMNKLHKDPPPGLYAGDTATPAYADYAVRENEHNGAQTVAGGYTAPDPALESGRYRGGDVGAGAGAGTEPIIDRPRGAY